MSKIIKIEYSVGTTYNGSDVKEIVELEIEDGLNEEDINKLIEEDFETWVWENIDSYWKIKE